MENDLYITEVAGQDENGEMIMGESTLIKKEDMVQLNDPNCVHDWQPDHSEDNEHVFGIKCSKCPVGKLIRK